MDDLNQRLAGHFDLTVEEVESLALDDGLHTNSGSTGDMVYSYYFVVPETALASVLESQGWEVGETVYVPLEVIDQEDEGEA